MTDQKQTDGSGLKTLEDLQRTVLIRIVDDDAESAMHSPSCSPAAAGKRLPGDPPKNFLKHGAQRLPGVCS